MIKYFSAQLFRRILTLLVVFVILKKSIKLKFRVQYYLVLIRYSIFPSIFNDVLALMLT